MIVMPSTPMALSASLTSSSLCGWMTASIFFMVGLRLEIVAFFAVHSEVETFDFLVARHTHSDHKVTDLQDYERPDDSEDTRNQDAHGLIKNLARVAVHHPERQHAPGCVFQAVV